MGRAGAGWGIEGWEEEGSTGLKCSHVLEACMVLASVLNALEGVWGGTEGLETRFCGEPKARAHDMSQVEPTRGLPSSLSNGSDSHTWPCLSLCVSGFTPSLSFLEISFRPLLCLG